ncbi:MAG: DUF4214 domain-containing protein [Telluria sp.]
MIAGQIEIQLMAGIARLQKDMDQARGVVNKATSDMARAANAAKTALMSVGAGLSLTALISQVGGAQRRFDVLNSSLITATGSVSNAAGAFKALTSFASSTPYALAEVTQAFVKLRNMGMDPSEAALRSYGNTAAAMGKSLNQMVEAVADAATGEFERLKEFGIKAKQNGDQVSLTFQGVSTTIGNNARDIEKYLQKLGETEFAGGMELRANTLDGAISNLGDTWETTMLKFAQTGGGDLARESVIGITGALTDLTAILDAASAAADKEGNSAREMGLIHRGLTTIFETVAVLGINVAYTFTQVGKELGGLAAQAAAIMSGDFAGAKRIGEMMRAEAAQARKDVDARTAAILGASAKAQKAMTEEAATRKATGADALAQFRIEQAETAKTATAANDAAKKKAAAAKAMADAKKLEAAAEKAQLQAQKEIADAAAEAIKVQSDYAAKLGQSVAEANREAEANEELARTFGMSKAAIEAEHIARMEERVERLRGIDMADDEIAALELVIAAKKRSAAAMSSVDTMEANKKAFDQMTEDAKRASEQIGQSLTDNIMQGGKSAAEYLRDLFRTLVLRPILSPIGSAIGSAVTGMMGMPGTAQAANAAGGASSLFGAVGNAYSAISGGMTLAGGLGTGFMGSVAGGLSGAGIGSGLTSAAGLAVGEGIAGVVGPQIAGALGSGMSMLAAAAPYLAAAMAVYAVWKKLDTSGTYHTGGASKASAGGVTTVSAESLNFQGTRVSDATNQLTASLASGIVKILDSTATAFGKTAGYTAATAFADDTSKDGAWGALVIEKMGKAVVDWQDTRTSRWAPKEFGDGEAGQAQYLAAMSASVRTALDDIGLPSWAQTMLDGLGAAPSIEDLAKVVDTITATQNALKVMGESLSGFADLSDAAVTSLIKAAGGIESLSASASAYYENFYSESERSAGAMKQVSDALAAVSLAMPANREEFRAMVDAQMALGESGMPAVAALFKVSAEFARLHPVIAETTEVVTEAVIDFADAARVAQDAASSLLSNVDGAFGVLQRVISAEKSRLADAHEVAMKALQQRIDTETAAIVKHKALSDAIASTLGQMSISGNEGGNRVAAQAQITAALAMARAGAMPAADSLRGALSVLSKDSTDMFATMQDYQRDFYRTQNELAELGKLSDVALSVEEKTLAALVAQKDAAQAAYEAEIVRLDAILEREQAQIDELKGLSTIGISVAQAVEGVRLAILAAQGNAVSGSAASINGAYKSALGRAPDAAGMEFFQGQAAAGTSISAIVDAIKNSPEAKAQGLFQSVFNRTGDAGGIAYWTKALAGGMSEQAAREMMMQSDEYKKMGAEGEATGASRIHSTRDIISSLRSPDRGNAVLAEAVDRLNATVERQSVIIRTQQDALDLIAGASKRTADTLEVVTEGGNAMRTV